MHCHNQRDKIRLVGVVSAALLIGWVAGGRRVDAESLDDSSVCAGEPSVVRSVPADADPLTMDISEAPAVSDDTITTKSIDDSAAAPVSDNSEVEYAPSSSTAASADADEASGSGSDEGAVLELPRVVNLSTGTTTNRSAGGASASAEGNDDDSAQSGEDGPEIAGDNELAAAPDQVGTLEDYENQSDEPLGTFFFAPAVSVVRFPRPPLFNPPPRAPLGLSVPTSPIILPPTSSGPFPSTSPLLMAPRFATPGGSFPSGGWMGARR